MSSIQEVMRQMLEDCKQHQREEAQRHTEEIAKGRRHQREVAEWHEEEIAEEAPTPAQG